MPNLFSSLLRYASYQYKKPEENILSGALAYVLAEIPAYRQAFARFFQQQYCEKHPLVKRCRLSPEKMLVMTQVMHRRHEHSSTADERANKDIIDIQLGLPNHKYGIFVECKIDAPLGPKQDIRYEKTLERTFDKGILAIVSRRANLKLTSGAIQCSWSDIYGLFSQEISKINNTTHKYIARQFLDFLKEKDMAEFEGLSRNELFTGWNKFYPTIRKYGDLMEKVQSAIKSHGYKTNPIEYAIHDGIIKFSFLPEKIAGNKLFSRKWHHPWKSLECGIFLYSAEADGEDYDNESDEGIYPYVAAVWREPLTLSPRLKNILRRNQFYFDDDSYINDVLPLSQLLNKTSDPKEQLRKIIHFYVKSLKTLERARIVSRLVARCKN